MPPKQQPTDSNGTQRTIGEHSASIEHLTDAVNRLCGRLDRHERLIFALIVVGVGLFGAEVWPTVAKLL